MKVNTEIDDDDLDTRFPDPDDEDDDDPVTALLVIIRAGDGTGHKASVVHVGCDATPELIAESLVSAVHGAVRTYSPAAALALRRWLVVPPGLEIVPGGED